MTAVEPGPDSPSPPRPARASPAQLAPGGRRNHRRAPGSTRPAPSPRGRPRLVSAFGLPAGNRGGGRKVGAPTRKRHIRSRKDPPPEQTLFGQRLIWSGPIWPCRFRLWEEGRGGLGRGQAGNSRRLAREATAAVPVLGFPRARVLEVPEQVSGWRCPPLSDGGASRHSGSSRPVLPY